MDSQSSLDPRYNEVLKPDVSFISKDTENVLIVSDPFTKLFNSDVNIDWVVDEDLKDKPMDTSIIKPLNFIEFEYTINKLTLHKAPDFNRVSLNALNALDYDNIMISFVICSDYFGGRYSIKEWQAGSLKILPKKWDVTNLYNWRGMNLFDIVSKHISIVIPSRLQKILSVQGIPTQFGSYPKTGYQDGLFSIRTFLQMRE